MSITQTLIIVFFILLATAITFGLFRAITKSSQQGETFYQKLTDRIGQLRMHKMLQALGINEKEYTRSNQVNEIEMHINRCRDCGNTEQCDAELESGEVKHADQYCPNNEDLLRSAHKKSELRSL
ncbi:MAG: hypothetical protein KAJ95_10380 [Gammaproteobacteria bacterium]|nr:hypothetical protein [Gammaproteobacteria bacterium]